MAGVRQPAAGLRVRLTAKRTALRAYRSLDSARLPIPTPRLAVRGYQSPTARVADRQPQPPRGLPLDYGDTHAGT